MMNRRQVLSSSALSAAAALLAPHVSGADAPATKPFTACVIGHTGKGDYGHGMDVALAGRADVEVLAVADPDEAGRAKAAVRSGAQRQYADHREMLEKEKPQLVAVAPGQTGEHHDMMLTALNAGAHVVTEKPFTTTPAEAASARGASRLAVAGTVRGRLRW